MQLLDPAAWSTLGVDVFVFLVLKGVPLSLALLLARRVLDGYGAGTRAAAWSLGLLGLALLPFLQLELAAWGSGVVDYPESWLEATGGGWPVGTWLLLIWGGGALYLLGRFAGSLLGVSLATRRENAHVPGRVRTRLRAAVRRLGIRRPVRLRMGGVPGAPLTWGWIRPTIVLPSEAADWSREQLDAVLYHELAHVRRHDFPLLVAMEIARALHWPNPLVRRLLRTARTDQELACDAATLQKGVDREAYARHLLALARSQTPDARSHGASLPVISRSRLGRRIQFILSGETRNGTAPTGALTVLAVTASAGVLLLASVNPWLDCL